MAGTIWDISVTDIDGNAVSLDRYLGVTLLIVNVASRCGFTPQYAELETLYRRHRDAGFVVLGFPCNQFGGQEPGSEEQIRRFCTEQFAVTFPMFGKVDVNGPAAHPLYRYLKAQRAGLFGTSAIKWNFTKFLVSRTGDVVDRFGPRARPASFEDAIVKLL